MSPGCYFRLLPLGYLEGIDSERGIAWRTGTFTGFPCLEQGGSKRIALIGGIIIPASSGGRRDASRALACHWIVNCGCPRPKRTCPRHRDLGGVRPLGRGSATAAARTARRTSGIVCQALERTGCSPGGGAPALEPRGNTAPWLAGPRKVLLERSIQAGGRAVRSAAIVTGSDPESETGESLRSRYGARS